MADHFDGAVGILYDAKVQLEDSTPTGWGSDGWLLLQRVHYHVNCERTGIDWRKRVTRAFPLPDQYEDPEVLAHPDTDEHLGSCASCMLAHDKSQPDSPSLLAEAVVAPLALHGSLSERECATVLHGLRMVQAGGRIEGCAAGACEHFDDVEPLTDAEIDELCERINLGGVQPGI